MAYCCCYYYYCCCALVRVLFAFICVCNIVALCIYFLNASIKKYIQKLRRENFCMLQKLRIVQSSLSIPFIRSFVSFTIPWCSAIYFFLFSIFCTAEWILFFFFFFCSLVLLLLLLLMQYLPAAIVWK